MQAPLKDCIVCHFTCLAVDTNITTSAHRNYLQCFKHIANLLPILCYVFLCSVFIDVLPVTKSARMERKEGGIV
jgi:hypothetical protein